MGGAREMSRLDRWVDNRLKLLGISGNHTHTHTHGHVHVHTHTHTCIYRVGEGEKIEITCLMGITVYSG